MENTETQTSIDWLQKELNTINSSAPTSYEPLPALILENGKSVDFKIDFSKQFKTFFDKKNDTTKAIIPVEHKGERKILWLNIKNPLYRELLEKGSRGQTDFSVVTTGTQANTRYNIVEKD